VWNAWPGWAPGAALRLLTIAAALIRHLSDCDIELVIGSLCQHDWRDGFGMVPSAGTTDRTLRPLVPWETAHVREMNPGVTNQLQCPVLADHRPI
jgi:hypothetical protein